MDNMETGLYQDKFVFRPAPKTAQDFGRRELLGLVMVSHTGLVVCMAIPRHRHSQDQVKSVKKSLDVNRSRVRIVDMAFVKDGSLLIAASNGDPLVPIRFYNVKTKLEECAFDDGIKLDLQLETFPGKYDFLYILFLRRTERAKFHTIFANYTSENTFSQHIISHLKKVLQSSHFCFQDCVSRQA